MKRKGFTLIELLVVVAIIVVLIAILLPSLGRARDQAKSTKCLANLKGLATSILVYADENGGRLVPGCMGTTAPGYQGTWTGNDKFWTNLLIDSGTVPNNGNWYYSNQSWGDVRTGIFLCPSTTSYVQGGGYGVSCPYLSAYVNPTPVAPRPALPAKITDLTSPAEYWLVGDACISGGAPDQTGMQVLAPNIGVYGSFVFAYMQAQQPSSRHLNGLTNIAYTDGHAASLDFNKFNTGAVGRQVGKMFYDPNYR